jgi:4-amino-4-deoxy-L-arabinose transferase-like glycosyltransferase
MQEKAQILSPNFVRTKVWVKSIAARNNILLAVGILAIVFLSIYHLTGFPLTWFDEGSHLHVPKTLVDFGVYADRSSEGFRYYGPTVGVGPTVFLPIAAVFKLFGTGLLQARAVIVLYLLATIFIFYRMGRKMGSAGLAMVATALLVTSKGISLLEYGREVLGEVPGFFFLAAGFLLWYSTWKKPTWIRLAATGLLFGLSMVTKNQNLLVLGPSLLLAWLANLVYYRLTPQRVFLVPGIVAGAVFVVWNVYMTLYLGPATASQNFAMLREATQGAALIFSPNLMKIAISNLLGLNVFLGLLVPVLIYGLIISLPRTREGQQWGNLFLLVVFNLVWYILASISWLRYAFPALAISSLFVARFFYDLTNGFSFDLAGLWRSLKMKEAPNSALVLRMVFITWLVVMIVLPLAQTARSIIFPPFNAPAAMAEFLNKNVPKDAVIETWEPEMGFLTDNNFHFPPPGLLATADSFIWLGKSSPQLSYHYLETNNPPYVLVGAFSTWVQLYPQDILASRYHQVTKIGEYSLYALNQSLAGTK